MDGPGGELATTAAGPEAGGEPEARLGAAIGRFLVLGMLGSGGMGVVLSAYDPQLDRKVAIKLLRGDVWKGPGAEAGHDVLVREAQAMARLAHPNVVAVHEIGMGGSGAYVVMEHVEGTTLRGWQKRDPPRPWTEVLAMYRQAGAGLAAAHHAGLVHRDFKPENVLVGADGRPRVTDFGLASAFSAAGETDVVAGTPAYMAPEQRRGDAFDARADQYAFCVSLWEALTGQRPGAGRPLEGGKLPERVRRAVARGLSERPDDRWPSLDDLLAALRHEPRARRISIGLAAAIPIGIAIAFLAGRRQAAAPVCSRAGSEVAGVWNDAHRAAIERAFVATGLPYAAATFQRIGPQLGAYAHALAVAHVDACRATHVRHEQSAALLDLRVACLERRRDQLDGLVQALSGPLDRQSVDRAPDAVARLARIADCADVDQLRAAVPLPADPGERARVRQALRTLSAVATLYWLGHFHNASALLEGVEKQHIDYAPVSADAHYFRSQLLAWEGHKKKAEAAIGTSLRAAVAARDAEREARAWAGLFAQLTSFSGRRAEAEQVQRAAELAVERAGRPANEVFNLRMSEIRMDVDAGREKEAEALARATEAQLAPDDLWARAQTLQYHADVLQLLGRYDEAARVGAQAAALWERELGPDNPRLSDTLIAVATAESHLDRYADARATLERALRVQQAIWGPGSSNLSAIYNELGWNAARQRDRAGTRVWMAQALAVAAPVKDSDWGTWQSALMQAGGALAEAGLPGEAEADLRAALALAREKKHEPRAAVAAYYLGSTLVLAKEPREALERCSFAEERMAHFFGDQQAAGPMVCRGDALVALGRAHEAVPILERALALRAKSSEPGDHADAEAALAFALWDAGDRRRALVLADRAAQEGRGVASFAERRAQLEAWRRTHRAKSPHGRGAHAG